MLPTQCHVCSVSRTMKKAKANMSFFFSRRQPGRWVCSRFRRRNFPWALPGLAGGVDVANRPRGRHRRSITSSPQLARNIPSSLRPSIPSTLISNPRPSSLRILSRKKTQPESLARHLDPGMLKRALAVIAHTTGTLATRSLHPAIPEQWEAGHSLHPSLAALVWCICRRRGA